MVEQRQIAERMRVKGNEAFKAHQYTEALRCYQEGLSSEKTNMALHSNAAMAALKVQCYVQAIEHCDKVRVPWSTSQCSAHSSGLSLTAGAVWGLRFLKGWCVDGQACCFGRQINCGPPWLKPDARWRQGCASIVAAPAETSNQGQMPQFRNFALVIRVTMPDTAALRCGSRR